MSLTRARRLLYLSLSAFGFMLAAQLGCQVLLWTSLNRVENIFEDPNAYTEKAHLGGTIEKSFSIPLIGSAYKLKDSTGMIWVLTKDDAVREQKFVVVTGYVKEELNVDDSGKWKPFFNLIEKNLMEELPKAGPFFIEKKREGIFRSLISTIWK